MTIVIGILAVISAAAAAGLRVALPLLIIGLLRTDLWNEVPFLSAIHPPVLLAILISWSLFELFGSKSLLGQRVLQVVSLFCSPFVGALMGWTVLNILNLTELEPRWLIVGIGALLAFAIKLVQVGWFFRLRGLPFWVVILEDILCVFLVFFALNAPQNGGIIVLLLLLIAIRSSKSWRDRYRQNSRD